ncbi:Nucleotidyltransferase family protein [Zea mays]|uniref:Nucleotidyltransferase family protein n=1 Tax=Zea mays TaxID=4577 RepID=A0A1D6NG38_MAIZE|nr:Nucleotidyltransferase family protein [Zea mays]
MAREATNAWPRPSPSARKRSKGKRAVLSPAPPTQAAATEMEAEASVPATDYVYDALPGLHLAFSPEETLDDAAAGQDEDDATATYAVFRNEITEAGDVLADIPAADFFSLDVSTSASVEPEPEPEPPSPAPTAAAATPSISRALEDQPPQGSERAWFRGGRRFRSPMLQLHKGEGFVLVLCAVVLVEVFGSFRTGLYLPTSDIDNLIYAKVGPPGSYGNNLVQTAKAKTWQLTSPTAGAATSSSGDSATQPDTFLLSTWLWIRTVIAKARVPIVKFVERKSGIAFDISFDIDGGPQAADFIKDAVKKLPALRPLCMILKVFLHQRELNELVWGGKDILGYHRSKEHNLGILLVRFFDFYGRKLNNWDVGVSCNSSRTFFLKSDKDFMNHDRPHLLAIQDPMAPDNDIGKNSFNYFKVKSAFSKAYSVLTDANLFISLGHNRSILGTIVRPDSVLLDRKGWNNEDMLAEPWEPITQQFDTENDAVYNWHVIDEDEPLPRNSQSTSEDTSSSPSKKRKSPKSRRKSRKKSKATASGSSDVANGFRKDRSSKREAGSSKRRKGPKEYDRFTNTLPKYTHVSKW